MFVVALGVLVMVAVRPPGASASASPSWATGVQAALPADAASNPDVSLTSVSCAATGDCAAVGDYTDTSGEEQGVLLTGTSGTWATGVTPGLPAGASSNHLTSLGSVSCPSAGNCTTVGSYADTVAVFTQGLLLTETSGAWATGVKAGLPADAYRNPKPSLNSVSCPSAGNCSAVGTYLDSTGVIRQGVLLTETSGTWATGVKAGLPADASRGNPALDILSVSCASAGNCSAVGTYLDSSTNVQGLLLTETSGVWATGVKAALPADAGSIQTVSLSSVSCASAGNCTAVGKYSDSSGNGQGLLLTETSGTWATGVKAGLPAGAASNQGVFLNSVSCASAGNCTAVGGYNDGSKNRQGVLLTETAGAWAAGVEAGLPAGAGSNPNVGLTSVSCPSAGDCTAVGGYNDGSNNTQGVLFTQSSGAWAAGVKAGLPAGAGSNPNVDLTSVSCASAVDCSAVGTYTDASDNTQGLLLSAVPASSPPAGGTPTPAGSTPPSTGGTPPAAGGSPSATRGTPAPVVSAVKLGSQRFPAKKGTTLKLTVSQAARIRVLITQTVKGHKVKGACERHARAGKKCTITLTKRTITLSARAGANAFKLKLPGLATGAYTATITAQNANGTSRAIRLTFTITHT